MTEMYTLLHSTIKDMRFSDLASEKLMNNSKIGQKAPKSTLNSMIMTHNKNRWKNNFYKKI